MSKNISNISFEEFNNRYETIKIVIEELKKTKEEDPNKTAELTSNERRIVVILEQMLFFQKSLVDKLYELAVPNESKK